MTTADVSVAAIAQEIAARRERRHLLLLCDFDGTLARFDPDPRAVCLPDGVAAALGTLASSRDCSVGVISGRRLQDVRDRVTVPGELYIAGFHGLEIHAPGESFIHPDASAAAAALHALAARVGPQLAALAGVFIEDKDLSIALHYREASPANRLLAEARLLDAARAEIEAGRLRVLPGSYVVELMPSTTWHKGSALEWIRTRVEVLHGPVFTVYLGDDVTDEDGFRAVGPDGIAIGASDRVREAEFRIDGPAAVEQLLQVLAATL
ncbi:MAG TPA: trehalose-phosphatase [Vicinamibacterales bacterium]|nr:trehalose-phosphatase [Vicinamibacterales bacterium]